MRSRSHTHHMEFYSKEREKQKAQSDQRTGKTEGERVDNAFMHDLSDGQRCNSEGQQFYTKDIVYAHSV